MKNILTCLMAFFIIGAQSGRAQQADQWESVAKSLVRLEKLSLDLEKGIEFQVNERGIASEDQREEIAVASARSLHRSTCVLHRRFFDGAESLEIEDRVAQMDKLSERLNQAATKIGLYGYLREKLAAFLNERDWLKRQLGVGVP